MYYTKRVKKLEAGVNLYGYAFAEHGIGEAVRLNVEILRQAGLDPAVIPYVQTGSRQAASFPDMGAGESIYDVNMINVNADTVPRFVRQLGRKALNGRYNIGLWSWEIEDLPESMASSARYFDEIWACSSFAAEAIARSVPCPVFPFPHPISASRPAPPDRGELGLTEDFLFLFCCDFNSIFERKNPLAVIEAFRHAFGPGEGARLLIKTINGNDFQRQMERLSAASLGHPDIDIVDGYLMPDHQQQLMSACDAYVSLHRAEGFGLTCAEAMAMGKPVIATGYSGNMDFMSEENSYPVPCRMVSIPEGCDPYPRTSRWAEPDVGAAAGLMRRVFERRDETRARAEQARRDIERWHTPKVRAEFVAGRWQEIRKELKKRAARRRKVATYSVTGWGNRAEGSSAATSETAASTAPDAGCHRAFDSIRQLMAARQLRLTAGDVVPDLTCGRLDGARPDPDGGVAVWGWAYDPRSGEPVRAVILLLNKQQLPVQISVGEERRDVADYLGDPGLERVGWSYHVRPRSLSRWEIVFEAYALLGDGRFGKLGSDSGDRIVFRQLTPED